ncbi:MAG: pyruvate kinase alpha/beta domain-containing protein [Kiritimatiellae bacterium]|nr:pyruvate kinase alpha/beta domain-containing protein [Kiritimatiellia bacterium]
MRVFERPGPVNTDGVIEIVERVSSNHKYVVAASITGDSALRLAARIGDRQLICVTCPQGMGWEIDKMNEGPFAVIPELQEIRTEWERQGFIKVPMGIAEENKRRLDELRIKVVQGSIPLFGPTFSMRLHLQKTTDLDLMAKTLELISTGTLVCLECVLMSVDAGVIPEGEQVIAVAGTERGLDTAWIIRASASHNLFHPSKGARFVELLAKPGIPIIPDVHIEYLR